MLVPLPLPVPVPSWGVRGLPSPVLLFSSLRSSRPLRLSHPFKRSVCGDPGGGHLSREYLPQAHPPHPKLSSSLLQEMVDTVRDAARDLLLIISRFEIGSLSWIGNKSPLEQNRWDRGLPNHIKIPLFHPARNGRCAPNDAA